MTTVIIDYQMGNLRSVQKAIEKVGGQAKISSDPRDAESAERLILPGVGAFGDAMRELRDRGWVDVIGDYVASGRPLLGICLGLQLLFDESDEGGRHQGLGIIPGRCVQFESRGDRKVPHMGWNRVTAHGDCPYVQDIRPETHFYFVHSHYVVPEDPSVDALRCDYGQTFTAAIYKDNIFATQFHPEKSQSDGLALLAKFLGTEVPAT